jgi:hypothetical protein
LIFGVDAGICTDKTSATKKMKTGHQSLGVGILVISDSQVTACGFVRPLIQIKDFDIIMTQFRAYALVLRERRRQFGFSNGRKRKMETSAIHPDLLPAKSS